MLKVNDAERSEPMPRAEGPLAGLVVTDLSTVLAGPYCAMLLADLGADVIKVEPPDGDPTRLYGPPYAGEPDEETGYLGESGYYLSTNRNKRGIRLDLRDDKGHEVLRRLVERSDVLVENMRPGSLGRLGFDDEALEEINPGLVHLSITGFGHSGPDRDKPGFDFIIQALSGLMSITGSPDDEGGGPTKVGVAVSDLTTGMLGAVAVLASLRARDAHPERRGERVDISLLGGSIAWLINQANNYLVGGQTPTRMGNRHPNITPYETFRTADGEIAVAVGSERQWHRFCAALELGGLSEDPRFLTNAHRVRERDALREILVERFSHRPSDAWVTALDAAEVPVAHIRDMEQVFADPQVQELGMVTEVDHPTIGPLRQTGIPWQLGGRQGAIERAAPLLGEHNDEVLANLGFSAEEIASMRRAEVI
jgi:crotonobetainyl-CoA:carnitine CoA-transferase CaiB-like acyl-CoA transferase